MILKNVFNELSLSDMDEVFEIIVSFYYRDDEVDPSLKQAYIAVLEELHKTPHMPSDDVLFVTYLDDVGVFDIYAKSPNSRDNETFSYLSIDFDEWLGLQVDPVTYNKMTLIEYCAHLMYEMTATGFTTERKKEWREEIKRRSEEGKNAMDEFKALRDQGLLPTEEEQEQFLESKGIYSFKSLMKKIDALENGGEIDEFF